MSRKNFTLEEQPINLSQPDQQQRSSAGFFITTKISHRFGNLGDSTIADELNALLGDAELPDEIERIVKLRPFEVYSLLAHYDRPCAQLQSITAPELESLLKNVSQISSVVKKVKVSLNHMVNIDPRVFSILDDKLEKVAQLINEFHIEADQLIQLNPAMFLAVVDNKEVLVRLLHVLELNFENFVQLDEDIVFELIDRSDRVDFMKNYLPINNAELLGLDLCILKRLFLRPHAIRQLKEVLNVEFSELLDSLEPAVLTVLIDYAEEMTLLLTNCEVSLNEIAQLNPYILKVMLKAYHAPAPFVFSPNLSFSAFLTLINEAGITSDALNSLSLDVLAEMLVQSDRIALLINRGDVSWPDLHGLSLNEILTVLVDPHSGEARDILKPTAILSYPMP